jgi:Immunoglobulin-like domain of bacterial spore germination/Sporulation and spore germination
MSSRDEHDPQLAALLRDAVAGVDPSDRLGELRARTSAPARRRPALLALGGAVLATAAVVTGVAVAGDGLFPREQPGPADTPSATSPAPTAESDTPSPSASAPPVATRQVTVYYLGDTPAGVRLYREDVPTGAPDDGPTAQLELLTTAPADPDYRTLWPAGAFAGSSVEDDRITVELAEESLVDRPAETTEDEAAASLQQVVSTMQAYAQQELPVEFVVDGEPAARVLGIETTGPVAAAPLLDTLALVSIEAPAEGETVAGRLQVSGAANSFEGTVPWTILDASDEPVDDGFFTAEGSMGSTLFPFQGSIDVSSLAPGTYSLIVETSDPSGGAEGTGPFSDSRTVVIE